MPVEHINHNCGIGAVLAPQGSEAVKLAIEIGRIVENRGQLGAGISTIDRFGNINLFKDGVRFSQQFSDTFDPDSHGLRGELALIHTRYSTVGHAKHKTYAQPFRINVYGYEFVIAHNGQIVNRNHQVKEIHKADIRLQTDNPDFPPSDSEAFGTWIAMAKGSNIIDKFVNGVKGVEGSFSVVIATAQQELLAARDPWGIRPLFWGRVNDSYTVASEDTALKSIGASEITEIEKGELWLFRHGHLPYSMIYDDTRRRSWCDFEDEYLMRPSSSRNGINAGNIRAGYGIELAREELREGRLEDVDFVVGIPETAVDGAKAFAEYLGKEYRQLITRKPEGRGLKGLTYTRSFMAATDNERRDIIRRKFDFSPELAGTKIYLPDDMMVRSNTLSVVGDILRDEIGVLETHARSLTSKTVRPCFLGINMSTREELMAIEFVNGKWVIKSDEKIAAELGFDSMAFLSPAGRRRVRESFGEKPEHFCGYCRGEEGPDFDMSNYDHEQLLEDFDLVGRKILAV